MFESTGNFVRYRYVTVFPHYRLLCWCMLLRLCTCRRNTNFWPRVALVGAVTPISTKASSSSSSSSSNSLTLITSAASVESALRNSVTLNSISAGILIPSGIAHRDELVSLARLWPPIPTFIGTQPGNSPYPFADAASYAEGYLALSNASAGKVTTSLAKRDGVRRILIVRGKHISTLEAFTRCSTKHYYLDSMTHGQEGDFTWRYHIWKWLVSEACIHISVDLSLVPSMFLFYSCPWNISSAMS